MDFSNRQNRLVRVDEVSADYLEQIKSSTQSDPYYPTYHIAPPHGLLNDPNGLSYFNGEHHIFYQWFPLGPVHGLKHWYHVSTKDFVHYQDRGVALYPDQRHDQHGCYTGIGVPKGDELHLYYTANRFDADGGVHQSQALAVMNHQGEIEKRGVLVDENRQHYTHEFRDPIIVERDSHSFMLIGAQGVDEKGKLAAYASKRYDSEQEADYQHLGDIDIGLDDFGYMWECPNYYEQDDKGIFIFSPQGVTSESKYDLKNVFSVVYMVGDLIDFDQKCFNHQGWLELDKGFDFYAPQTYLDDQGRRILIGWLGNSKSKYPTDDKHWAHMLTIPRVLSTKGNRLVQRPLEELKALRFESQACEGVAKLKSNAFELTLMVENEFSLALTNDKGEQLVFSASSDEYVLDRSDVSELHAEEFGTVRYAKRLEQGQEITVYVDHSSIEIFADNGQTVFTSRLFVKDLSNVKVEGCKGAEIHYLNPNQFTGNGYDLTIANLAQSR